MRTNVKMRVTPEQSRKVQEICFKNNIYWIDKTTEFYHPCHGNEVYLLISNNIMFWNKESNKKFKEIDADLFIRTNGTCEENELENFIQSQDENIDMANDWLKEFNNISLKLKKKNEILKKARIKRKNQREELHKLNIKLQKCISLEEHKEDIEFKNEIIKEIEDLNYLNKSKLHLANLSNIEKQKEIEKLKVVIEYLESKVK